MAVAVAPATPVKARQPASVLYTLQTHPTPGNVKVAKYSKRHETFDHETAVQTGVLCASFGM